ncbi:MAG TPA: hypothetical protein VGA70_01945 [Longimicrobiales bacterium]
MISSRLVNRGSRDLFLFGSGLAMGFVAALGLRGRDRASSPAEPKPSTDRFTRVRRGAAGAISKARGRAFPGRELDAEALAEALGGLPGADAVAVRVLGEGIVEVVGEASDDGTARDLLAAVAREAGVEVVVNRVWTPSSASPGLSGVPRPGEPTESADKVTP